MSLRLKLEDWINFKMIEHITHNNEILSIIIYGTYTKPGVNFFTPSDFSQQLGYMKHNKGHIIAPHVHLTSIREVTLTQEVLIIKNGKLRVDFYTNDRKYIESRVLQAGDIILLSKGGHGFEALEDLEMIEVKQGPYQGESDKSRFKSVHSSEIIIKTPDI